MKYTPKLPDESVNVTTTNFFGEALKLLTGVIITLGVSYLALMAIIGIIIDNLSIENEKKVHQLFSSRMQTQRSANEQEKYLQSIVDELNRCAKLPYSLEVFISDSQSVNAMAVIGGTIIVTQGMMNALKNENELTFVLGHEMGHFKHRDHLKGISSAVVLTLLSMFISQSNSTTIINHILQMQQMQYSRKQESQADEFGVDMLVCRYQNATGAFDLFARMTTEDRWSDFMLTHPNFSTRVEKIEQYIKNRGYQDNGELIKLKL
jgi:Zn-dependent protease with chaperone function